MSEGASHPTVGELKNWHDAALQRFIAYTAGTLAALFFLFQLATSPSSLRFPVPGDPVVIILDLMIVALSGAMLTTFRQTILVEIKMGVAPHQLARSLSYATYRSLSLPLRLIEGSWLGIVPDSPESPPRALDALTSIFWLMILGLTVLVSTTFPWNW